MTTKAGSSLVWEASLPEIRSSAILPNSDFGRARRHNITNANFKTVLGPRLCLRALRHSDVENLHGYRTHPDVAWYQSWDTDYSLEDADQLVRDMAVADFGVRGTWYQVGIALTEDDVLIGDIGVYFDADDKRAVEIGYTLGHAHQGKGLASEALGLLLAHLETAEGITSVRAVTDIRNQPSRALLKRLGFKEIRVLEQNGYYKGEWCDEVECFWTSGLTGSSRA